MMNPYELNWPGLRDVPVVTVDKAVDVIYSQENLLPLKRGKLDKLECKYVPIEAVLDEFNAEIELEEAFETLESILDIPGVKPLYTDKSSGRKYVHVSSLLALIVLRPEDGPGFETACHSILHFLMNHLEMACLECGFIRRDCLCQVYDVCLDPKNIECVSYAKQSAEKDVQTDPIDLSGVAASLGGQRPGTATTVFLPPGANLSNCEQLPDGRLNIKYVKPDGKGEVMTHHVGPHGMPPPGMMLPPGSSYYPGTSSGFVPPTVPVCHSGVHPAMMATHGGYMPITTSPLNMMSTMMPTSNMSLRQMGPAMYGPGIYPGIRAFYPNSPVITTASSLAGHFQTHRMPMPTSQASVPVIKLNSLMKKDTASSAPDKGKSMKRSHEKQVEVSEEPKTLAIVNKRRRKSLIVPLKDGASEEKEKKLKTGRKVVTLTKVNSQDKKTDTEKEKESEKGTSPKKDAKKSKSPETKGSPIVTTRARTKSESLESPKKEEPAEDVNGENKDSEKVKEENKEKANSEEKEQVANGVVETDEKSEDKENEEKSENMDTKDVAKDEKEDATAGEGEQTETAPLTTIKAEILSDNENASGAPNEVEMTQEGGNEENEVPASPQASDDAGSAEEEEQQKKVALYSCKGWDVFEYAPTGQQMIRCLRCGQCFDKENYAEQHNIMHTEQRSLRCTECEYTVSAARWYTLLRHLNSKHSTALVEEENSCKLCGNVFKDLEELEEHVDVHHYNKYKCTYCGTSLLTWDAYQHHVGQCPQLAQGKTYYSCPYCHFAFRDRLMKQVHVKSHQDDALVCCYCRDGKDWGNWKLLKNHYELLHLPKVKDRNPKKAKACPQCAQVFKSYKGFRNHVAKCTGPKKVEEVAEKKEEEEEAKEKSKPSDMETSPEKSIKPEQNGEDEKSGKEDGEENADEGDEKENIQEGEENANETADSKTGVKKPRRRKRRFMKQKGPFKCEKCHKKFGAGSTLDRHMSYAHGAEAKCDECDHVAKTPMLLKMHKTLKHSEKRHICSECNRTFMYYHQYKVHLAWHARKVAYACPTCDAEFPRQMELRQHQLTEHPSGNNRTVFTCSGCDFKCFSRTTLRAHLRNKHLSSDEEDDQSEDEEKKYQPNADGSDSDASRDAADKSEDEQDEHSDSETESDVGEEDLQKLFSWRQARPAPEGARRSSRTPKPSTKLVDIARTRKLSQRKKDMPSKKGRRRRSSSPRRPPSPQPPAARRRRPGMKGRPPKRVLKPRKMKKEKVEKKVKLRRCGCARFRTFAEFKILKKRMEDKRIVETTIVEDASTPMRRRTLSQESEPEPARPPKVEAPEVSWTYDTTLSSHELSPDERHQLMTVVLDHAYYQKPGPPPPEVVASMMSPTSDSEPKYLVSLQGGDQGEQTSVTGAKSPGKAAGVRRKRLSSGGSVVVAPGQSPAKVRATVNDLESAIKFADNINQLSKLVSILRADKDEIPAAAATNSSLAVAISSPAASFLQSPPRTRIIPVAGNSGGATTMVTVTGVHGTIQHGTIQHGTIQHGTIQHGTIQRPSISDYEIGDIEPLPSDIMASEMDSDIDMQGVMSEILEEMRQGNNSGVSPDVSSAAEVLLSLDMSAEERELVPDSTRTGMLFTQSPARKLPAVSVEYVNLGQNSQEEVSTEDAEQDEQAQEQQDVESPPMEEEPEEEMVLQEESAEPDQEQLTESDELAQELVTAEQDTFVIENVPLSTSKVAVELTNVNIPQNDFLFWAAKHDDSEEPQVAVVAAAGQVAEEPVEGDEDAERTTWQLDHQYF